MTGGVQTRVNCLHLCWKERDAERKILVVKVDLKILTYKQMKTT